MGQNLYKVLVNGKSCHGGDLEWSLPQGDEPGGWHQVNDQREVKLCHRGLHLTSDPQRWFVAGCDVYLAEGGLVSDGDVNDDDHKVAFQKARLLRKLSADELVSLGILVAGDHKVKSGQVIVSGNATATLCGNATAMLYGNAKATLYGNATATLYGNAKATLYGNATATLYGNATATLCGNATATLYDNATATLYGNATATLCDNATGIAQNGGKVVAVSGLAVFIDRNTNPPKIRCGWMEAKEAA